MLLLCVEMILLCCLAVWSQACAVDFDFWALYTGIQWLDLYIVKALLEALSFNDAMGKPQLLLWQLPCSGGGSHIRFLLEHHCPLLHIYPILPLSGQCMSLQHCI